MVIVAVEAPILYELGTSTSEPSSVPIVPASVYRLIPETLAAVNWALVVSVRLLILPVPVFMDVVKLSIALFELFCSALAFPGSVPLPTVRLPGAATVRVAEAVSLSVVVVIPVPVAVVTFAVMVLVSVAPALISTTTR